MNKISFSPEAWEDYTYWQNQDKKTFKKINDLIKDIMRNGTQNSGLGKTEPLKYNLSGYWSKRIDNKNRIIFKATDNEIEIIQCRDHYNDK